MIFLLLFFLIDNDTISFKDVPKKINLNSEIVLFVNKIVTGSNCYYLNDYISSKVLCFDLKGLKYQVGSIGQGPGEYEGNANISYSKGTFYIFQPNKNLLNEYDDSGKFIRSMNFKQNTTSSFRVSDFINYKGSFYLVQQFGKEWVSQYDKNGSLVKSFHKTTPEIGTPHGNLFSIFTGNKTDELLLFSRFTGEILSLDILNGKDKTISNLSDPTVIDMLDKAKSFGLNEPPNSLILVQHFSSLLNIKGERSSILNERKKDTRNKLLFMLNTGRRITLDTSNIVFKPQDFFQSGNVIFITSDEGDLYWTSNKFIAK